MLAGSHEGFVRLGPHTEMMAGVRSLPTGVLRRICEVLGDVETGLTGREIRGLPWGSRYRRSRRNDEARSPLRGLSSPPSPRWRCQRGPGLSAARPQPGSLLGCTRSFRLLAHADQRGTRFSGITISEKGEIQRLARAASTLSEARIRANRFREALRAQGVHQLVISGCALRFRTRTTFTQFSRLRRASPTGCDLSAG